MSRAEASRLRLRRAVVLIVLVMAAVWMGAGSGSADPEPYGFDEACNQLHETLSDIPGLVTLGDAASAVCKAGNVVTHPSDAVATVRDKAWDTTFGSVVDSLLGGLGQALIMAMVWWTRIPNDQMLAEQDLWNRVSNYTNDIQVYLLSASVMIGAVRIAIARHHAHAEEAGEVMRVIVRSVFAVWVAGAVVFGAARATDAMATWIIDDATRGNARGMAEFMVETSAYTAFSPGLVLILACVGILAALAMAVMAILRQALLIVAMGLLPLAAAGSGLGAGRQAHNRLWCWIVAFLLWKPVAALVYLIAFTTVDTTPALDPAAPLTADDAQRRLVGLVLLSCAVFVLPALMRLISPIINAAGSGGSGAAAAGTVLAAGAAIATGGKTLLARGASAAAVRSGASTSTAGGSATGHIATHAAHRSGGARQTPATSTTTATGGGGTPAGAAPGHTRTASSSRTAAPPPTKNPARAGTPLPPARSPRRGDDDIPI